MAEAKSRVRKLDLKHKKRIVKKSKQVPGGFRLLWHSLKHLWLHKRLFGGILLLYVVLYILLVRGLAGHFELGDTRQALKDALGTDVSNLTLGAALLGTLVGTASSVSGEAAGVYQGMLFVIGSLAYIWALRQTYDGRQKPAVRAAFYQGAQPLIPYLLVGLVVLLQLLPALIGITLYGIISSNGIAVGALEQIIWFLVLLMTVGASVYLVSASLFASYIVTLPGMTPMRALRSARQLVRFRRFLIIRKVVYLPFIILLAMGLLFLPLVFYAPVVAELMFLLFVLLLVMVTHAYFYTLYRELL